MGVEDRMSWYGQSYKHSQCAKGFKTGRKRYDRHNAGPMWVKITKKPGLPQQIGAPRATVVKPTYRLLDQDYKTQKKDWITRKTPKKESDTSFLALAKKPVIAESPSKVIGEYIEELQKKSDYPPWIKEDAINSLDYFYSVGKLTNKQYDDYIKKINREYRKVAPKKQFDRRKSKSFDEMSDVEKDLYLTQKRRKEDFGKTRFYDRPVREVVFGGEKIPGIKIVSKSVSVMGDYRALHGRVPNNELPVHLRGKIPKNELWIRSDQYHDKDKTKKSALFAHERYEIYLMKKYGLTYKQAHKRAELRDLWY
jgi:hypothetical protein